MSKVTLSLSVLSLACMAGTTLAQDISTVNGFNVQLRQFNDFQNSTLFWGPAGSPVNPAPVPATASLAPLATGLEFQESWGAFSQGNGTFANKHQGLFSNNGGATPFGVNQNQSFSINTDVNISAAAGSFSRKEGGIKFYNNRGNGWIDEGEVMIASDNGEVAVFGAGMLFTGFGAGAYTLGTTAHLTYNYFAPGVNSAFASYQVIFTDAVTGTHNSGIVDWDHNEATNPTNPANGLNSTSVLGFLDQSQRNPTMNDNVTMIYGNVSVVPTPAGLGLLGLAGLATARRRR